MAKSTKEFEVLRRNASKIQRAITDAKLLAMDLFSENLISFTIVQKVSVSSNTSAALSMELVTNLLQAVVIDPNNFHKLIEVLENHPPLLTAVANEMKENYDGVKDEADLDTKNGAPSALEVTIEEFLSRQVELYDENKANNLQQMENLAIVRDQMRKQAEVVYAAAEKMKQDVIDQIEALDLEGMQQGIYDRINATQKQYDTNTNEDDWWNKGWTTDDKASTKGDGGVKCNNNKDKGTTTNTLNESQEHGSTSTEKGQSDIDVLKINDEVQQTQADQLLDITDLATVFQELTSSQQFNCTNWYQLGLYLGLYECTLKAIEEENKGNLKKCLMECLSSWLKGEDGIRETRGGGSNWISLVAALNKMGQREVADDIRKSICNNKSISNY